MIAGRQDTPESADALEHLCRAYWYPLYAFVRRRGYSAEEARDLTQEFFGHLIRRRVISDADPTRGRFRTFLIAALKNFLANEWDRSRRQKRGGGAVLLSLDDDSLEEKYRLELTHDRTPEAVYEQGWAAAVVDRVSARLREELGSGPRAERFEVLKAFLFRDPESGSYADVARRLNLSVSAVTSAIHRMRVRFRELFRAEIAQTVSDPSEIDEEIRHLVRALGERG